MNPAAMLWTGGKDSAMALYEAAQNGYDIRCLVTFAPPQPDFLAHPLSVLKLQAEALKLPHHILQITEPFAASYETSLKNLRDQMGINTVITGDIAEVGGQPNWITERARPVGMAVHMPLWGRDRQLLLEQLLERKFKVRLSCVNTRWLSPDWVGRELTRSTIKELHSIRAQNGLDLCGEEGEYHTLVTDAPQFTHPIELGSYATQTTDSLAYLKIRESRLYAHAC